MKIDLLREQFFLAEDIYLANHSLGCLPKKAIEESQKFFKLWQDRGANVWEAWLAEIDTFCKSLGVLFNAKPEEFCPQTNISEAVYKIFTALPQRKGRTKILISDLDFPSVGFVFSQAKGKDYILEYIKHDQGTYSLDAWSEKLTKDIQLVIITHVLSDNSFCNDVASITRLARERGIFSIVDIAQSAGIVPIDLQEWSADFIVGSCVKWLCGGPGAGFLWANSLLNNQCYPKEVGWFSHKNPFELDIYNFEYASDAKRYWGGSPSVLPFIIANSGLELIKAIGVKKIQQHNQELLTRLLKIILELGYTVNSPLTLTRGGTLVINPPSALELVKKLKDEKVIVDHRKKFGIRISPHVYNTMNEIDIFISKLKYIIRED